MSNELGIPKPTTVHEVHMLNKSLCRDNASAHPAQTTHENTLYNEKSMHPEGML